MKTRSLVFAGVFAAVVTAGCAATGEQGTTPAPTPIPVDTSLPWRMASYQSYDLAAKDLWAAIESPRQWPAWFAAVADVKVLGAELRPGTSFTWQFNGKPVESTVLEFEREKKLSFEGTPFSAQGEVELLLTSIGEKNLINYAVRLRAGWKKRDKAAMEAFYQQLGTALGQIK